MPILPGGAVAGNIPVQPGQKVLKTDSQGLSSDQKSALLDVLPSMQRIVHLDLKGAAPKVSYLEQLFPLFKTLGATGLLIGKF